jgi:carotenoid cleavage dioxygenase
MERCAVFHDQGAHDIVAPDGTVTGIEVIVTAYARAFDRQLAAPTEVPGMLERWTIDLVAGTVTRTPIDDRSHEFPRVNEALGLAAPRYLYTMSASTVGTLALDGAPNLVAKHDLQRGTVETVSYGPRSNSGEAVFVPDPDRPGDEDGGWLLSFVYDFDTDTSRIAVVDAQDLASGPIASVLLPVRVPLGFHATWVPV